jgi:hypothetical protein
MIVAYSIPVRFSPEMLIVSPTYVCPRLKISSAVRPMSSAAMPGSLAWPIGRVMNNRPSSPRSGGEKLMNDSKQNVVDRFVVGTPASTDAAMT